MTPSAQKYWCPVVSMDYMLRILGTARSSLAVSLKVWLC